MRPRRAFALGMALRTLLPLVLLAVTLFPRAAAAAAEVPYPLDELTRQVPARGRMTCPVVPMVRYAGSVVRYHKPVMVYAGFAEHLRRFEEVVRDTAVAIYGRAPRRIVHVGTYNCRRIRTYPTYLSEHGLGNAIDVEGFDFDGVRGAVPADLPKRLRGAFTVRLGRDWRATSAIGAVHARFLELLARRLVAREEIFRVLLGPAYPGHEGHFHFDMSPWRIVEIWQRPDDRAAEAQEAR